MKTFCPKFVLLLTMLLVNNLNLFGKVNFYNNTRVNDSLYSKVITFACKELKIDTVDIILSEDELDNSLMMNGSIACVHRLSTHIFSINIECNTFKSEQARALIHEIYHIKQMLDNKLRIYPLAVWFEGKLYTKESNYEDRPYEVEAFEQTEKLYNKYRKLK